MQLLRLACLLFILSFTTTTQAQDIPYDNYLVGDRALGLGGAFVGLADDGSATFHNPAGLTLVPETAISASFWVAGIEHRRVRDGWRNEHGESNFSDTALTFPPLVVTAVTQLGERGAAGRSRHALGAALLKPLRQRYRYTATTTDGANQLASIDVHHEDNARWYGVAYAYRPMSRLSFGASAFVALRDLEHEEFEAHDRDAPLPADLTLARHSVLHASLRDLIWRFGVVWNPVHCWRVGAMLQLPGIGAGGSVDNRELTVDTDATGVTTAVETRHHGVRAFREIPWELRMGVSWFHGRRALVTADLAVHGPVGSERGPVVLVREPDFPGPRLLPMSGHRGLSYRAALGGELVYRERFPVRGGVLLYTSGAPAVPAVSDAAVDDQMITLGASMSVGLMLPGGHQVSVGTAFIHASGEGSALEQSPGATSVYRPADVSDTTVLVFISGGVAGAKELAKTLVERGEEWMQEQQTP